MTEVRGWSPGSAGRGTSTFWCLRRADSVYKWGDFEVTISTGDAPRGDDEYAFCHPSRNERTVPDFNFHRWPEAGVECYEKTVAAIGDAAARPPELRKAGWIGSASHATRRRLHELGTAHRDVLDVTLMTWRPEACGSEERDGPAVERHAASEFLSLPELAARFAILIDVEGLGYSGRLKYLLFSGRPVLVADRPMLEWFHFDLEPWVHYCPVKRDLSDLVERAKWCVAHPEAAADIGANGRRFALAHLTREACFARWDAVVRRAAA